MLNGKKKEVKMKSISKATFYIKYYATKYGEVIERKGQLDDVAKGEYVCKKGHKVFNYLDIWATEKFGSPQYRNASVKWEFNETPTLEVNHINSVLN